MSHVATVQDFIESMIEDELKCGNVVTEEEVRPYATKVFDEVQAMLSDMAW